MLRKSIAEGPTPFYRVNVAPIIDVALTLVIMLLITAPMLSVADLDLDLPTARTRDVDNDRAVMVTISKIGEFAVDDAVVVRRDLRAAVAHRIGEGAELVVVRADAGLPHDVVDLLIQDIRDAGATRIAIATSPKVPRS